MGPILLSDNQLEFGASKNTGDVKLLQEKKSVGRRRGTIGCNTTMGCKLFQGR